MSTVIAAVLEVNLLCIKRSNSLIAEMDILLLLFPCVSTLWYITSNKNISDTKKSTSYSDSYNAINTLIHEIMNIHSWNGISYVLYMGTYRPSEFTIRWYAFVKCVDVPDYSSCSIFMIGRLQWFKRHILMDGIVVPHEQQVRGRGCACIIAFSMKLQQNNGHLSGDTLKSIFLWNLFPIFQMTLSQHRSMWCFDEANRPGPVFAQNWYAKY